MTDEQERERAREGVVPVIQADRELSATFLLLRDRDAVLAGRFDYLIAVQRIARYRIEAAEAARRDALERAADLAENFPLEATHPDAGVLGCRDVEIAAAIRALGMENSRG